MSGERDLGRILSSLEVRQREGVYVFVNVPPGDPLPELPIAAMVSEVEGTSIIVNRVAADAAGLASEFEAAWLTLDVHTSLDAVGVTASMSTALAVQGIPCNVVAGFHHDHILVPLDRVEDAIQALSVIRAQREAEDLG